MTRIPILVYHQIDTPPPRGTPMRGLVVAPQTFAWQMRMLALLGFRGLSMRDLEPYRRGERAGKVAGITFDDGYRNNLQHALPVLLRHGFTASCYAVSGQIGGSNKWDGPIGVPSKPLMDQADLRHWTQAGMEVGAHTRDHLDLTKIDLAAARNQIVGCRADLEDALDAPVHHFCYPYGHYDARHVALVRQAGYRTATTMRRGRAAPDADPLRLPRVLVARSTHPGYFFLKLCTAYEDRRAG